MCIYVPIFEKVDGKIWIYLSNQAREIWKVSHARRQWRFHGRISAIVNGEFVSVAHDFLTVWGIERDRKPRYVNVTDIRWIGTENRARVQSRILRYRMHINAYISTSHGYVCITCDGEGVHACGAFVCAAKYREQRSHARHGTRKRRNRFSLSPRSPRFAYDRIISLWGRSTAELLHGNSISRYRLPRLIF